MYFSSKGKIKKNKYVAAAQYFLGSLKRKSLVLTGVKFVVLCNDRAIKEKGVLFSVKCKK